MRRLLRRSTTIVWAPIAVVLALFQGWTLIVVVLPTETHTPGSSGAYLDNQWWIALVSGTFAVLHLAGYFGFLSTWVRRQVYLTAAVWLGAFAGILFADGYWLTAGGRVILCGLALFASIALADDHGD